MKQLIQFQYGENDERTVVVTQHIVETTNLKIREIQNSGNMLLCISHSSLNTLLDFTGADDFQIIYLNQKDYVNGSSFAVSNSAGFMVQTQCKRIILVQHPEIKKVRYL